MLSGCCRQRKGQSNFLRPTTPSCISVRLRLGGRNQRLLLNVHGKTLQPFDKKCSIYKYSCYVRASPCHLRFLKHCMTNHYYPEVNIGIETHRAASQMGMRR